jgi:tRNA pseudouridine38-40 synthase
MALQRYFLEVMYKGTAYSGFQVQENAPTVQAEVEKAFVVLQKEQVSMTGSSRTDSGVHALQNFFHFDAASDIHTQFLYKINAILPRDIVVRNIYAVGPEAHCRFDAVSRTYQYHVCRSKNPFLEDRSYFFPLTVDIKQMQTAAAVLKDYNDYTSFSKRNTQVKTFLCSILESEWQMSNGEFIFHVRANRFLRGMVRGLTGTMLQVGRGKISIDEFRQIIESKDCTQADFAVPGHGLFLTKVEYPKELEMLPLQVQ